MSERILSVTIKDCEVQTFRSGGKGGQNQNKVESGVRVIHRPSGAVGEARDSRDQLHNKRAAFRRMATSPRFKVWLNERIHAALDGKSAEQVVDEAMAEKNLRVEVRDERGRWTPADPVI